MYTVHSICHLNIYNYFDDDDVDNFEDGGKSALVLIPAGEVALKLIILIVLTNMMIMLMNTMIMMMMMMLIILRIVGTVWCC